jgi:hypothetical protein
MTTPMPTFADGAFVHQASLNLLSAGVTNLSTLLNGVVPTRSYIPAVGAKLTSSQSVANATDQTVSWSSTSLSNDGMWVNTLPQQLTLQTGGVFIAWAQVHFTSNSTGTRACHIMLNGTSIIANSVAVTAVNAVGAAADNLFTCMSPPMRLAPGATLYLSVFQNSGVSLNLLTTLSGTTLSAIRIGN